MRPIRAPIRLRPMDSPEQTPAPSTSDRSIFRDLRARNERRRAMRASHTAHRQRVERVIEAARAHARLAKPFQHGRPPARSDRP